MSDNLHHSVPRVRRAFTDGRDGQIHYHYAEPEQSSVGATPPLVMLHASPGSGRQLVPLLSQMATSRRVIAPDTPGHGDSVALSLEAPVIGDYAHALLALLDTLGLERVDLYGTHTGGSIAAEVAMIAPDRVNRLVLDGVGAFTPAERASFLAHYAHPFTPDLDGAYLMRAFQFCRDQYLFFPWFDRSPAARLDSGLPPASDMHSWLVEVLKAAETYHLAYRAAFVWDAATILPQMPCPVLTMAAQDDPLFAATREIAATMPASRFCDLPRYSDPTFTATRLTAMTQFLGPNS